MTGHREAQRIVPMLAYDDAPAAIRFLCSAFGFVEKFRMETPDGGIGHAELRLDGDAVMVATTWREGGLATPAELGAVHAQLFCWVADVDAHHRSAMAAGATIAAAPADQPYGARMYRAVDPEGHRWLFATAIAEG